MFLLVVSGLMTCVTLRLSRRRALSSRLRLLLVMPGLRCLLMCRLLLFAAGFLVLILAVLLLPLILLVYLLLPLIVLAYRLLLLKVRLPLIHRALLILLINLFLPPLIVLAYRLLLLKVRLPLIHRVLSTLLISLLPLIRLDHRVLLTIVVLLGLIFPIPVFAQPVGMIARDPTRILVVPPFAIMPPALRVECTVLIAPSRV